MAFSGSGAAGGAASGALAGARFGPWGAAAGGILGGVGGALSGGGAKAAAPVAPVSGLTPQQLEAVLRDIGGYLKGQEGVYRTPTTAGGVGVTQTSEVSPTEQKRLAYIQFRMSKGDTQEQATQKANAVISNPNKGFKDNKNFIKSINQGNYEGLSKNKNGGINAAPKYIGGGVETPGLSEAMQNAIKALGMEGFGAASGQAGKFANDNAGAFDFRQGARNQLGQMLGNQDSQGLSSRDYADIDALMKQRTQQLGDLNQKNTAGVVGDLVDRGFMSSNLAGNALQRGVYDPQARFLTDLGGELAGMETGMRNSAASRNAQAFGNVTNAFNTAGSPYEISSILGGLTNPGNLGLFGDVTGAAFAGDLMNSNITNRRADQTLKTSTGLTPTLTYPNQSMLSNPLIAGALGGAATAAGNYFGAKKAV
jgi:hypothetical protein